jgi:hypothetical protein
MVTVHGYASPAQAEFFESMDLHWMVENNHPVQVRRFIHEAEDFVVFSPFCINKNEEALIIFDSASFILLRVAFVETG